MLFLSKCLLLNDAAEDPEDLCLTLCVKQMEARTKQLEMQASRALDLEKSSRVVSMPVCGHPSTSTTISICFDITKHIQLVPPFREDKVGSYFNNCKLSQGVLAAFIIP